MNSDRILSSFGSAVPLSVRTEASGTFVETFRCGRPGGGAPFGADTVEVSEGSIAPGSGPKSAHGVMRVILGSSSYSSGIYDSTGTNFKRRRSGSFLTNQQTNLSFFPPTELAETRPTEERTRRLHSEETKSKNEENLMKIQGSKATA